MLKAFFFLTSTQFCWSTGERITDLLKFLVKSMHPVPGEGEGAEAHPHSQHFRGFTDHL